MESYRTPDREALFDDDIHLVVDGGISAEIVNGIRGNDRHIPAQCVGADSEADTYQRNPHVSSPAGKDSFMTRAEDTHGAIDQPNSWPPLQACTSGLQAPNSLGETQHKARSVAGGDFSNLTTHMENSVTRFCAGKDSPRSAQMARYSAASPDSGGKYSPRGAQRFKYLASSPDDGGKDSPRRFRYAVHSPGGSDKGAGSEDTSGLVRIGSDAGSGEGSLVRLGSGGSDRNVFAGIGSPMIA